MQIREIFKKNIARPINGVVKADQLDEAIVWQELDEYVVTRELDRHFRKFLSAYAEALDKARDPVVAGRIGVWVSGFFGSGKSHFIKILSYILSNRKAFDPETRQEKKAAEFFETKIKDPMMLADIKRIAGMEADVILFNIDSKADSSDGRSAVLSTFWRVFNESQGFCGEYLFLSEVERYLAKKGKYEEFKAAFRDLHGSKWEDERDAYALYKDVVVDALSSVLNKSADAAAEWFDKTETEFKLTIENFAKRVKDWLDDKTATHRLVFLVDEIGQFIGNDTHLMLNLQTIVEDLGRICAGKVWVIVTSQEDIDKVLGDIKASKGNDFSKITGRFHTRLSLSSSNTDEVIQARLLLKTEAAESELKRLFDEKGDILKNQLGFSQDSATLKNFTDAKTFSANYPFAPFHFQLVQNIFESIRKAGVTGLHLARGERSMLDAFQSAATSLSAKLIGALVPLHEFFPCIENFLDTAVILSINNAKENSSLEMPFDLQMLQTLFLIRYVELIKPNVDNLVTLCIDQADADRISLRHRIEDSLVRLEKQHLISRNGDLYFFLTNEEREVSREIEKVEIPESSVTQLLSEIVFDDVLKGKTKHRYAPYKNDYPFNRVCDERFYGKELKDELGLEIISPLHEEYSMFTGAKCIPRSAVKEESVLVRLPDEKALVVDLRTYLQTGKYIKDKSDAAASTSLKQILRDRADENRTRRNRLVDLVDGMMARADYYAMGKTLDIKSSSTSKALDEAFDNLIQNVFGKYGYLTTSFDEPLKEIKSILQSDDVAQQQMVFDFQKSEPLDIKEIRTFLELKTTSNQPVVLSDLVRHFARRPYGWGELQIVVLVAKLFMAGVVSLVLEGGKITPKEAVEALTKTPQWKNVKVVKRATVSKIEAKNAQKLAKELFGSIAPEGQDPLAGFIRDGLKDWNRTLEKFKPLADTGKYPGKDEIDGCIESIDGLLKIHDSTELVKGFNSKKDDLGDASEDLHELKDFYKNQKAAWETLREAADMFRPNRNALEKSPDAAKALKRMDEILTVPRPYGMIKEVNGLVAAVEKVNQELLGEKRKEAVREIDEKIDRLKTLLKSHDAEDDFSRESLYPLQEIKKKLAAEYSLPQIVAYVLNDAQELYDDALETIEEKFKPKKPGPGKKNPEKIRTIKLASLKTKAYLDTDRDVEDFVEKIRTKLLEAVEEGVRIRVE